MLPPELRFSIWKLSCQPRIVEVRYDADTQRCRTTAKPPGILRVSREARQEGLFLYKRAFRTAGHRKYIYFSPRLDILYLPRHGLMGYSDTARDFNDYVTDTADHVWSLAIDHVKIDIIRPWEPYNKLCLLQSFPNLKSAFLVLGAEQDQVGSGEIELVDPKDDPAAIIRLIDNVIESFCYEIGPVDRALWMDLDRVVPRMPSLTPKSKVVARGLLGNSRLVDCT